MRWGVEKRLEFIEFRLFWEGGINRSDITEQFGVSVPQASKDLTLYEMKAPGNLVYDRSAKRYLASSTFRPLFLVPQASTYLSQLSASLRTSPEAIESWLAVAPDCDIMPLPYRRVQVEVLRPMLEAIRNKRAIDIEYQSMNKTRPEPEWRRISPHALAHDGLRWHVRSYCHFDHKFKDFILSRCLSVGAQHEHGARAEEDRLWQEIFEVKLVPNERLSKAQRTIISNDYEMVSGTVVIPVRKALLYYFEKRLRLDVADLIDQAHEAPVVVSNRVAFNAALKEATS